MCSVERAMCTLNARQSPGISCQLPTYGRHSRLPFMCTIDTCFSPPLIFLFLFSLLLLQVDVPIFDGPREKTAITTPEETNEERDDIEAPARDGPPVKLLEYSNHVCYNCKQVGHIKGNCTKPRSRNNKHRPYRVEKPINIHVSHVNEIKTYNGR
ncbi:hypothetical protein GGI43DRAFT_202242 [Trichoderma evansii]